MERMEKFSELSSSSSEKHLITHLNPIYDNNNLEHYKILYKDVLDNLLKLHILKIDRDKKINSLRFNGFGKEFFDLIKYSRITNEIKILDKEDKNKSPEKEKLSKEINEISQKSPN